jgi:hypothetical protein
MRVDHAAAATSARAAARLLPFQRAGLTLHPTLQEMLVDHPVHCTLRRGCGFTQATRHLASRINQPRDPRDAGDLGLLGTWTSDRVEAVAASALAAGWPLGWRELNRAPDSVQQAVSGHNDGMRLIDTLTALDALDPGNDLPELQLFADLLRQVVGGGRAGPAILPPMATKPAIGSCSQAEEFFLEIAHGKIRRGGQVNVYVDGDRRPVLVEKIDLGESHSAMSVAPVTLNNVLLPAGSLFALNVPVIHSDAARARYGVVLPLESIAEARFLRLSTLVVAPSDRLRVFSRQFQTQIQLDFLSPASTTVNDLHAFAQWQVDQAL